MANSASTLTENYTPVLTLVKESKSTNTKKSANENRIHINTLTPKFNFKNNRGETIFYKALKI